MSPERSAMSNDVTANADITVSAWCVFTLDRDHKLDMGEASSTGEKRAVA